MKKIKIYDTTLRDGTQSEGVSLSADEKIRIALELDKLGVDYIEGGWPGSNPKDKDFFKKAKSVNFRYSKLAAFSMTKRKSISIEEDQNIQELLAAETPVVTIVGKSWDLHVNIVLKTSLKENIDMIYDTIKFLKDNGKEVIFDAEHYFDGFKSNSEYALKTILKAQEAGADCIVLCDTNGGIMPDEFVDILRKTKENINIELGIHCHNDSGLAIANTIIAANEGITHIQGTINGIGERCGNADLIILISNLQLKNGLGCIKNDQIVNLRHISRLVYELMNLIPDKKQPYVGESAFAHKGGMHVNAVQKNPRTYEHIDPNKIGNIRRILASDLSGKSNIIEKASEFKIQLDNEQATNITTLVKEKESQGYAYEIADASLELLMMKSLGLYKPFFETSRLRVYIDRSKGDDIDEALLNLKVKGSERPSRSSSNEGPVDALNKALRGILLEQYPFINNIHLIDFKVRIIDGNKGTGATTRVLIDFTDGKKIWTTVGVGKDIISASYDSLVEGIEYGILKSGAL